MERQRSVAEDEGELIGKGAWEGARWDPGLAEEGARGAEGPVSVKAGGGEGGQLTGLRLEQG